MAGNARYHHHGADPSVATVRIVESMKPIQRLRFVSFESDTLT